MGNQSPAYACTVLDCAWFCSSLAGRLAGQKLITPYMYQARKFLSLLTAMKISLLILLATHSFRIDERKWLLRLLLMNMGIKAKCKFLGCVWL